MLPTRQGSSTAVRTVDSETYSTARFGSDKSVTSISEEDASEYSDSTPSFADVTMEIPTWNPYAVDVEEFHADRADPYVSDIEELCADPHASEIEELRANPYASDIEELRDASRARVQIMSTNLEEEVPDVDDTNKSLKPILKPANACSSGRKRGPLGLTPMKISLRYLPDNQCTRRHHYTIPASITSLFTSHFSPTSYYFRQDLTMRFVNHCPHR
jgi:hypothetical protein